LTKVGNGTLTLTGPNTYTGPTTISAGVLQIGTGTTIPSGPAMGDVTVNSLGTLDINGQPTWINALNGNGTVDNTSNVPNTLTLGFNNHSGTFGGVIQNTGGALTLAKTGAGVETLTGADTYTGGTTIDAGTLVVTGAVGGGSTPGAVHVPAGVLDVNGSLIASVLDVNNAGGLGSGQLAGSGTITLVGEDGFFYNSNATSTFAGTLQGAGAGLEVDGGKLILTGSNAYEGGTDVHHGMLTVTTIGALPTNQGLVIEAGGTLVFDPQAAINGDSLAAVSGGAVSASPAGGVEAIPEPGTLALLGATVILATAAWRRRNKVIRY
jgi:autotransporter-associated beta strand protein